jgi:adenosylmethionine-8-amino-7-oxononanoate aminotransferase
MSSTQTLSTLWHPYTQHALAEEPIAIAAAKDATLITRDGKRIFDAISSWWVTLHGHAHPHIAQALAKQAATLEQVIFAGFTHEPAEQLAKGLVGISPEGLEHVFLSDNGSTAVEVALKMALGHFANRGEKRTRLLALEHAYHGDTFGAMSVSARSDFTATYDSMLFEVARVPFPKGGFEINSLLALEKELKKGAAALIVEPLVLGAGGMLMYRPETLRSMRELCTKYGALFIADEVMTGFGRTGTLFACEQAGISPDIMTVSKGITGGFLPLGATLATEEVFKSFYAKDRRKTLFHGHSYAGSPMACAAAVASLEIFQKESVLDRIAGIEDIHAKNLDRLRGLPGIKEVRQRGTIAAIEFDVKDAGYLSDLGPRLYRFYLERGVLLRPLGNVIYLLPPYCSTETELTHAYDTIEESINFINSR